MKTDKQSEKKDLKRNEDSNDDKDTATSSNKVINATEKKEEMDSPNESRERKDALGYAEGSKDVQYDHNIHAVLYSNTL